MSEINSESCIPPVKDFQHNEPIHELEFQVSSVLNRLEEAVEKFDGKGTIISLESTKFSSLAPRTSREIIDILQDAIVKLNLAKEFEEPNLAILPALRDVAKLSLLSHSIKNYIACLDVAHSDYLTQWIVQETSVWLTQLFGSDNGNIFYTENYFDGCLKLFRLLLIRRYRSFNQDGFEALREGEPVIYCNTPAMFVIAKYLCNSVGLPLRFIHEVPMFSSQKKNEIEIFKEILMEDLSKERVPLLLLASAETQLSPSQCNLKDLQNICREHKIWLHLIGSFIAAFPLLKIQPDEQNIPLADSFTVTLGAWLNIPALPAVTIYKVNPDDHLFPAYIERESNGASSLPLWATIQCLGHEQILDDFVQKFDSCQKVYFKLEKYNCLKIISQGPVDRNPDKSILNLVTKSILQHDFFESIVTSVIFKFSLENNDLWAPSYCDKLNSWLSQILHRELPFIPISVAHLEEFGTVLCYSPFTNTPTISDDKWELFYTFLSQQLDILKSTVAEKENFYKLVQKSTCLRLIELSEWAGLGGVRYIPTAWYRDSPENVNKDELNRLNLQIVQQLRSTDSAFSIGETTDGFSCIRFGMVGWDSDVADLINLVESVGKQEEDSWNFIDTMAEMVKKGIETAMQDLQKENEEKLWQEGILRHVPVFGNIMNWWSPISKENGGIKGRSLILSNGVIESTENIYRYHMQRPPREPGTGSPPPQPVVVTPLKASDEKAEDADDKPTEV